MTVLTLVGLAVGVANVFDSTVGNPVVVITVLGAAVGVAANVGKADGAGVGEFVGLVTTGACTVIVNPVNPGEAAKLEEMALVVAESDSDDAMVAPETDGGLLTT